MSFPDKAKRQACWDGRDKYWQCLDKYAPEHSTTSGDEGPKECEALRKLFESGCPNQWIIHFNRKRSYEQFKKKMEAGYDPVNEKQ